jgi:hypothetical protein
LPERSGGEYWASISSLKTKPPAVSTTARRARTATVWPNRRANTPTTAPSSTMRRSAGVSVEMVADVARTAAARCSIKSQPVERLVLARWPRGAGRAIWSKG